MTTRELCMLLCIPPEVISAIEEVEERVSFEEVKNLFLLLTMPAHYMEAHKELKQWIGEDKKGFVMLTAMMQAAKLSFEKYQEKGISKEIFIDTMKCFPRFIEEHKQSYGDYGFDRDWWVGRQLSLQLFRIGELEYEIVQGEISIHIPSDAELTVQKCRESYQQAREFFEKYFVNTVGQHYYCCSWLLSPALEVLLPSDARINCFRKGFRLLHWEQDSMEFLQWVYIRGDVLLQELPEDTTLRKKMKAYLLNGGKVGEAKGELIENPWS